MSERWSLEHKHKLVESHRKTINRYRNAGFIKEAKTIINKFRGLKKKEYEKKANNTTSTRLP